MGGGGGAAEQEEEEEKKEEVGGEEREKMTLNLFREKKIDEVWRRPYYWTIKTIKMILENIIIMEKYYKNNFFKFLLNLVLMPKKETLGFN